MAYKTENDLKWEQIQLELHKAYMAAMNNDIESTKAALVLVDLMIDGIPNTTKLND